MKKVVCAICNTNINTKLLYTEKLKKVKKDTYSARRTPDRNHFAFLKCNKCGLIFSNPIFDSNKIHKLYKDSSFNYQQESDYLKKTYYHYFIKMLKDPKKDSKILEIGCGNGFFLEELLEHGYKYLYGIEPGKKSVEKASKNIKKNIKVDILKEGLFKDATFDIICCFHTLDHIIDLNKFMFTVNKLLKKGGKIMFIVHDTDGLSSKILGEKSPIYDIEHIYLFNKKSLYKFIDKYKYINIENFTVTNKYPLIYWLRLMPLPEHAKHILINFITFFRLIRIPISIPAGNMGVIGKKK